VINLFKFK